MSHSSSNYRRITELLAEEILLRPAIVGGGHSQVGIELLAKLREEVVIAEVLRERRQIVELARASSGSGGGGKSARRALSGHTAADGGRERKRRPRERQARGRLSALHEMGGRGAQRVARGRREQTETRLAPLLLAERRRGEVMLIRSPGHCWSPLSLLRGRGRRQRHRCLWHGPVYGWRCKCR